MGEIDAYVAGLSRALTGPRRFKADLVVEARDSLHDAACAHEDDGLSRGEAERAAVAEFGSLREIVPGYQAELSLAQAKRTALIVFTMLVGQTVAWGPIRTSLVGHEEYHSGLPATLDSLIALLGTASMLAAVGLIIGLRFAATRPHLARVAGTVTLILSVVFPAIGVSMSLLSTPPGQLLGWAGLPWTVAFGVLPMVVTAVSARSCLRAAR